MAVQRDTLNGHSSLVFSARNGQILDTNMKETRKVAQSILGVSIGFL